MKTSEILTDNIIKKIKQEISAAAEREVFFLGTINSNKSVIDECSVLARGSKSEVPAIISDVRPGNMVIHNHPSGNLEPSAADIRQAARVGEQGIGFAIIDNQVEQIYVVVEPKNPKNISKLHEDKLLKYFTPGGKLSENLPEYEYREQQLDVVKRVIDGFNQRKNYMVEAGTGTGKSFAYLLPAIVWSKKNDEIVVISTNTINLQEQLLEKDLVFLSGILSYDFKAVLVKGRRNYICKRKLNNLKSKIDDLFGQEKDKVQEFEQIINWLENTDYGTRSELDFTLKSGIWKEIASESELCLSTVCPYFDSCFFMQARKEIYSADILITNHHLLLSDASLKEKNGKSVLPRYRHLVIDEAHNFPDTATYHLGQPIYFSKLNRFLGRVNDEALSIIPPLRQKIGKHLNEDRKKLLKIIDNKIFPRTKEITEKSHEYFNTLNDFFSEQDERMLRITGDITNTEAWKRVQEQGNDLCGRLNQLGVNLNNLYKQLAIQNEKKLSILEENLIELEAVINSCQEIASSLKFNLEADSENFVFWLEKDSYINQRNAPLDTAAILPEILWAKLDNVFLTSATLTVNGNFDFFHQELGLDNCKQDSITSPFDYEKQAKLLIVDDIPPANSRNFISDIIDDFCKILISTGGSTLVLFTSYRMLNFCVNKTETALNSCGMQLFPQGRFPRRYIINKFRNSDSGIIFGTVSFWEGIDIKGEDLETLIIMKLPFPVPSRPVAAARREKLQAKGVNPFFNYSLPRAVIRFKQGFGRLIRSRDDRGIVITMDNRVINKSYGSIFLNSLPSGCPVTNIDIKSIPAIIDSGR